MPTKILLCERDGGPDAKCFDALAFPNHDVCDASRIHMTNPSRYICKAGDDVPGFEHAAAPAPPEPPFLGDRGFGQFASVQPMPACGSDGDYCHADHHKLKCCAKHTCVENRCVPTLPLTAEQLRARASGVADVAAHEAQLLDAFVSAPTTAQGMRRAAAESGLDLGAISRMRADSVRCFPQVDVDGTPWREGPHRCYRV